MSQHFPLSWAEWKEGTETLYQLQEILQAREGAGIALSKEEQSMLRAARKVTGRYERNGHKNPFRIERENLPSGCRGLTRTSTFLRLFGLVLQHGHPCRRTAATFASMHRNPLQTGDGVIDHLALLQELFHYRCQIHNLIYSPFITRSGCSISRVKIVSGSVGSLNQNCNFIRRLPIHYQDYL